MSRCLAIFFLVDGNEEWFLLKDPSDPQMFSIGATIYDKIPDADDHTPVTIYRNAKLDLGSPL